MVTHLCIADDLTGGGDAGIAFAAQGLRTHLVVSCEGQTLPVTLAAGGEHEQAVVINTDSRHCSPNTARQRITALARQVMVVPGRGITFKKIDSTLRGNVGAELEALMADMGYSVALVAPSYPSQGRTVQDGVLYVDGVPVHKTGFAHDPVHPVREASIVRLLREQGLMAVGHVPLSAFAVQTQMLRTTLLDARQKGQRVLVCDALTEDHLTVLARTATTLYGHDGCLFVGSAGLAYALARVLVPDVVIPVHSVAKGLAPDPILFVCGSANARTLQQVRAQADHGCPVHSLPHATTDDVLASLRCGNAVLTAPSERQTCASSSDITRNLGELTANIVRHATCPRCTLFMTGGETALATLNALGVTELTLHEELLPGVVRSSVTHGMWKHGSIITKAGGFGEPDTLVKILGHGPQHHINAKGENQ